MAPAEGPDVTVVVPARNEAENLAELLPEIAAVLGKTPHEIILVDDGSSDDTAGVVARLAAGGMAARPGAPDRPPGKSAAFMTGAIPAPGAICGTAHGDCQDGPRFVPRVGR